LFDKQPYLSNFSAGYLIFYNWIYRQNRPFPRHSALFLAVRSIRPAFFASLFI
jgi:hypothetical protein